MNTGTDSTTGNSSADPTRELLARLWQRNLPLLQERLAILDAAAIAHPETFPSDLRTQAIDAAHKLAGSLGMFGYPSATDLAREIETLLEASPAPDSACLTHLTTTLRATLFPLS